MHILIHALINLILGYSIVGFSQGLLIIIISGIIIDIDHIFNEIWKGTLKNPKKVIKYWASIPNKYTGEFYLFHSYEFILIIFFLSKINTIFYFIFLGLIFHFIADAITNINATKSMKWLKDYSVIFKIYDRISS